MEREFKLDPNLTCEICGKQGAYDIYGDIVCQECLEENKDHILGKEEK